MRASVTVPALLGWSLLASFACHAFAGDAELSVTGHVLAYRAVPDRELDRDLIDAAMSLATDGTLPIDDRRQAGWIPVQPRIIEEIEGDERLTLRRDPENPDRWQLLVILAQDDITEHDLTRASLGMDRIGRPLVYLELTDRAGVRFGRFTASHINRPLVAVVDGEAQYVATIRSEIRSRAAVGGFADQEEARQFVLRLDEYVTPRPMSAVEVAHVVAWFARWIPLIGFLLLALWPAPGFVRKPAARGWSIVGGAIGLLVGARRLGITTTSGPAGGSPDPGQAIAPGETIGIITPIVITHTLSIGWLLLGGLIGACIGVVLIHVLRHLVLRAGYNLGRLLRRQIVPA